MATTAIDASLAASASQLNGHGEIGESTKWDTLFSSDSVEHYTPPHIIELVEATLGPIFLDPCSNSRANPWVPAKNYYTAQDDGLVRTWGGTVFMNPPYGREINAWVAKFLLEYNKRHIRAGIALLPARTDTGWFAPLYQHTICFVRGRLKFGNSTNSAPFPSALVYVGPSPQNFVNNFRPLGHIVRQVP